MKISLGGFAEAAPFERDAGTGPQLCVFLRPLFRILGGRTGLRVAVRADLDRAAPVSRNVSRGG